MGNVGEDAGLAVEGEDDGFDALLRANFVLGEGKVLYPSLLKDLLLFDGSEVISYLLLVPRAGLRLLEVVQIIGGVSWQ